MPPKVGAVSAEVHEIIRHPLVGPLLKAMHGFLGDNATATQLRPALPYDLIKPLTDEELEAGYRDLLGIGGAKTEEADDTTSEELTGNDAWRYPEYQHLRETPGDAFLTASDPGVADDIPGECVGRELRTCGAAKARYASLHGEGGVLGRAGALLRCRPMPGPLL